MGFPNPLFSLNNRQARKILISGKDHSMPKETFRYTRDELTVVWKPILCIHSGICARGLPGVFDPRRKPWIDMNQAEKEQIIEQVEKCPSGALSIEITKQAL